MSAIKNQRVMAVNQIVMIPMKFNLKEIDGNIRFRGWFVSSFLLSEKISWKGEEGGRLKVEGHSTHNEYDSRLRVSVS